LNTYPFLHIGLFHTIVNILALVTLLDKFEQTNGTITTVAMLLGRKLHLYPLTSRDTWTNQYIAFSTFVGVLYVLLSYVFHIQYPIQGARYVP
jgi:membrane associated rhomboid family serine protease